MPSVEFKPITKENWRDCINLKVTDAQKHFVAPNNRSLLQAYYEPENRSHPYGIYAGETMVGFLMSSEPDDILERKAIYIHRFMIDAEHQGKGYGKAALLAFIERIKNEGRYQRIYLSYEPENEVGKKLYASVGFVELGISEEWGGEMGAEYALEPSK